MEQPELLLRPPIHVLTYIRRMSGALPQFRLLSKNWEKSTVYFNISCRSWTWTSEDGYPLRYTYDLQFSDVAYLDVFRDRIRTSDCEEFGGSGGRDCDALIRVGDTVQAKCRRSTEYYEAKVTRIGDGVVWDRLRNSEPIIVNDRRQMVTSQDLNVLWRLLERKNPTHHPHEYIFNELDVQGSIYQSTVYSSHEYSPRLDIPEFQQLCGMLEHSEFCNVTKLNIRLNDLQSLNGLQNLTQLKSLDASCNRLALNSLTDDDKTATTPQQCLSELHNLTNLKLVNLSHNALTHTHLSDLRDLTQLRELYLGSNEIKNVDGLQTLTALTKLDLSKNVELTNIDGLQSLHQLRVLDLKGASLTNVDKLRLLTQLQELDLTENAISNIDCLHNHIQLRILKYQVHANIDVYKLRNRLPNCKVTVQAPPPRAGGKGKGGKGMGKDIGIFGTHVHSVGVEFLNSSLSTTHKLTKATVQDICGSLDADPDGSFFSCPKEYHFLNKVQCAALMQDANHAWAEDGAASKDFKHYLTQTQLISLVGAKAFTRLASCMGNPPTHIVVRRCCEHGRCIKFHKDRSLKTMQVPLNGEHEYKGGRLVFVTRGRGMTLPVRSAGSATLHRNNVAHGVTTLVSGIRYGLFLLEDPMAK